MGKKGGKGGNKKKKSGSSAGPNPPGRGGAESSSAPKLPTIRQQLAANHPPWVVHEVAADGNCLFRSLLDQLAAHEGVPENHVELRRQIVDFIEQNGEFYSCFMEDDETIEDYVKRMREDQTWGGHVELHAVCRVFGVNVRIYQDSSPPWNMKEWGDDTMTLFVSYHDGNHYNSVRSKLTGRSASIGTGEPAAGEAGDKIAEDRGETEETPAVAAAPTDKTNKVENETETKQKKGQCPCGSGKKYRKCCRKREQRADKRDNAGDDRDVIQVASTLEIIDI